MGRRVLNLARFWGFAVAALVLAWTFTFKSSFLSHSATAAAAAAAVTGDGDSISQLNHTYSALHPLLMVIGFILLSGEAILADRRLAGRSPATRKLVQLFVQAAAVGFGLFGVWAKFKGKDGIVSNFYSLHSWIGLSSVLLLASQWVVGFISMWHRTEGRRTRPAMLPWHVFFGLYTFGLAVTAAETGLQEKLTFLQGRLGGPAQKSREEAALINSIGIALAILPAFVILAAISPKHSESQITKFVNGKDAANGKSHV